MQSYRVLYRFFFFFKVVTVAYFFLWLGFCPERLHVCWFCLSLPLGGMNKWQRRLQGLICCHCCYCSWGSFWACVVVDWPVTETHTIRATVSQEPTCARKTGGWWTLTLVLVTSEGPRADLLKTKGSRLRMDGGQLATWRPLKRLLSLKLAKT